MLTLTRGQVCMRPVSNLAMAIALATTAAVTLGVLAEPAHAQRKRDEEPKAPKADYSREFIKVYQEADKFLQATPQDAASAQAAIPGVLAAISTPDDRMVAGQFVYNTGIAASDTGLQKQGLDLMIESGRLPAERQAAYYYNAGQLAYQDNDFETARSRFQQAADAGYTGADMVDTIATVYFSEDRYQEGVKYYTDHFDKVLAAGGTPKEDHIFRAFSAAYNNDLGREAIDLAGMNVKYHPNDKNWRNAIAVQRIFIDMKDDVVLDLMRLADRTKTMDGARDYAEYIEAADARRLPGEVKRILDEAIAVKALETSDPFVKENQATVAARLASDRAELPALERDARAPNATSVTATAAGDVLLSYGEAAKAEQVYAIAATKSGVNADLVLTRMGIAQVDQGKYTDAAATFAKVGGARKAVAALWLAFVNNKLAAAPPAAATDAAM